MTSYIDERLDIGIIYETVGSVVGWDTTIINRDNGYFLPIERQFDSIGRWNVGDRRFSKREFDYLLNFFYNVRGNLIAFKYKDWGDYQATNQAIATGDGTETEFQLIKTYGNYAKPIYKPIADTIAIYLDDILQTSGYTVNSVGLITFAIAPLSGVDISADFEFDLVVRFENESLPSRFDAYDPSHPEEALYNVPAIYLIEVLPIDANTFVSDRWKCQDGICILDPDGTYSTQAECEAARTLLFTGGQCVGTSYTVTWALYGSYLGGGSTGFTAAANTVTGPISNIYWEWVDNGGDNSSAEMVIVAASGTVRTVAIATFTSVISNWAITFEIISITGTPDDCGDRYACP
jgi:uncharacterized protein (TIGR02217 family)